MLWKLLQRKKTFYGGILKYSYRFLMELLIILLPNRVVSVECIKRKWLTSRDCIHGVLDKMLFY